MVGRSDGGQRTDESFYFALEPPHLPLLIVLVHSLPVRSSNRHNLPHGMFYAHPYFLTFLGYAFHYYFLILGERCGGPGRGGLKSVFNAILDNAVNGDQVRTSFNSDHETIFSVSIYFFM